MANSVKKWKRRIGVLLSPRGWALLFSSFRFTLALMGFRDSTPLDRFTLPWEKERGLSSRSGRLLPGGLAIPFYVAGLPIFFFPLFPRLCLRRSLVLYRHLIRWDHDPELIVGIRKRNGTLQGHAWVRLDGALLMDTEQRVSEFSPVFSLRKGRMDPFESKTESTSTVE